MVLAAVVVGMMQVTEMVVMVVVRAVRVRSEDRAVIQLCQYVLLQNALLG